MTPAGGPFDAATLEVLWTRLISVVDEQAKTLRRVAFSTLVNESNDFACLICDAKGRSLAQNTDSIPSFIGTLPASVKHFIREIGAANMRPGDVLITNDPWLATGHLPDVTMVKPAFLGGRLVGFVGSTAHVPDIGGHLRSALPREVFEEGFFIPPMKFIHGGEPDEALIRLIEAAVRTPDQTLGDLWAQVTGLDLAERRLIELMTDYGLPSLDPLADEFQGRAEAAMRAAIRALPDGTYRNELETDGTTAPVTLRLALTIAGDEALADYAGSSPAQGNALNCPMCYTFAMTAFALKAALSPRLPNNEGVFRSVRVTAPERSIVNPLYPTAVGLRAMVGHYLPALVLGALARVIPGKVMAGAGSPLWNITQSGVREGGKPYANNFFFNGGMGALPFRDGQSALSWPSNISNVPVEMMERNAPFLFRHKRLAAGSGGRGRFRGGLGQEMLIECESETPVTVVFLAERTRAAAPGIAGGGPGRVGAIEINGRPADPKAKHVLGKGDTLMMRTPGGGGYGPPGARDPGLVERDRRMGYVAE
ncbi:MAG: hydantoinase B/oxoprolinase family protein [Proteobacteria bacterium]|nr:hydantoinase B/oxoprolinase family protein [Pseudomonadota bacterium]